MKILFPALLILFILAIGITVWVYKLSQELPGDRVIRDFNPEAVTIIYDKDGHTLTSFRENKNQIWVPLANISEAVPDAVIASEDPYFFKHSGIDYRQTWESIKDNLRVWRLVRGGSTVTQQVAKNVFLSQEKTLKRKIKEYYTAKKMERYFSKEKILEMYMNEAGWGYGFYGIELASRFYMDKHAYELNTAEAAFLVAMLRNPAYYNPYKNVNRVIQRQRLVLGLMRKHDFLTEEEYDAVLSWPVILRRGKENARFTYFGLDKSAADNTMPCYARLIEEYLIRIFDRHMLYDVGLEVGSTLDDLVQYKLEDVIRDVEIANQRNSEADSEVGVVIEDIRQVRAIGCTSRWEDVRERMKGLGVPFDSYTYKVAPARSITWRDILLVEGKTQGY